MKRCFGWATETSRPLKAFGKRSAPSGNARAFASMYSYATSRHGCSARTALYVQAEVQSDETPNAVSLRAADVERLVRQMLPENSLPGLAQVEIGHEEIPQSVIERAQKALAQAPPVAFDVARQVRVFEPYIQYVEIRLRGCAIQRHRIVVPKSLQGIASSAVLASRLRTTFDLIEKSSESSSRQLEAALKEIRDTFTSSLGKPWGRVLLRARCPEFDKRVEELRERLAKHKKSVVESLAKHLKESQDKLVEHFFLLVQQSPPEALLGQITNPSPTSCQIRAWLEGELSRVIPDPSELLTEMTLDVQFRDVTYETLTEDGFAKRLREAYPQLEWDKPFAEFDAARHARFREPGREQGVARRATRLRRMENSPMYDLIGDIHGHADELIQHWRYWAIAKATASTRIPNARRSSSATSSTAAPKSGRSWKSSAPGVAQSDAGGEARTVLGCRQRATSRCG